MAEEVNKRLDRIEEKLDKMGDALINLARFEEKIISYSKYFEEKMDTYNKYREESWERMNRFSEKLDAIEKKVEENSATVAVINKLFWVAIVAASGAIAAQIWM